MSRREFEVLVVAVMAVVVVAFVAWLIYFFTHLGPGQVGDESRAGTSPRSRVVSARTASPLYSEIR